VKADKHTAEFMPDDPVAMRILATLTEEAASPVRPILSGRRRILDLAAETRIIDAERKRFPLAIL